MNLSTPLADLAVESRTLAPTKRAAWERGVEAGLLVVAAIFLVLHFVHLKADFPNHSPWMDWSKYTDEGWYGDAAIRHYQLGHWNVPGDFNPAAALPVWPTIEMAVFRVTGVSLVAARALTVVVFGLILVCCYGLIRRWSFAAKADAGRSLGAAIAVVLLAVSPFCFVFVRLAILEPLLILLTLAAMLAATFAGEANAAGSIYREGSAMLSAQRWIWMWRAVALGALLLLMVLTKTTGLFLFPAILWMLWAASEFRWRETLRASVVAGMAFISGWGAYYGLFIRRSYKVDYHYLFSANAYTGITKATFWKVLGDTLLDASWIGATLAWLAAAAVVGALVWIGVRRTRVNPLVGGLLLWIFGYAAFLAYHDNLQPRYYLVLAIPLTMLVAVVFDEVLVGAIGDWSYGAGVLGWGMRGTATVAGGALAFVVVHGAWGTLGYVLHPEYAWVSAAEQVRQIVDRTGTTHPGHSRLLLSISGSEMSLMNGVPSICDDFGTMELEERVSKYKPGWFATWNDVEDDKMDALTPAYRLVRMASIPVFDDPERNLLILYRLDAAGTPVHGRRRRALVPHRLRTKIGEQPTPLQLEH